MRSEAILRSATFDRRVIKYWMISTFIILAVCVVTIVLIPVVWAFARPIMERYLARMSCELTERSLILRKGWLNRIEKTIPLDKITDLAMFQGPIMRAMDLKGFRVETAGSGGAATGYLVSMIGIIDTDEFRAAVLDQKERVESEHRGGLVSTNDRPESDHEVLREIRDILVRLETSMTGPKS
jgi:putative membrane protein